MKYRTILPSLWGSRAFRALSPLAPSGQALLLRLLTGPEVTAVPGVVLAGEAALAEALGWKRADYRRAFAELEANIGARAERGSRLIWLPNEMSAAPPANPNVSSHFLTSDEEIHAGDDRRGYAGRVATRTKSPEARSNAEPTLDRSVVRPVTLPHPLSSEGDSDDSKRTTEEMRVRPTRWVAVDPAVDDAELASDAEERVPDPCESK